LDAKNKVEKRANVIWIIAGAVIGAIVGIIAYNNQWLG